MKYIVVAIIDPAYMACYCTYTAEPDPATKLWDDRFERESQLNDWLRELEDPPEVYRTIRVRHKSDAKSLMHSLRRKLVSLGYQHKSARDRATVVAGKQPRRTVRIRGKQYPSVRRAALALGISPSYVTLACQNANKTDWEYIDD